MSERVLRLQARPLHELEVSPIEPDEKAILKKHKKLQKKNILDRAQPSTLCYFWLTILMLCVTLSFVISVLMVAITRIKCYRG